MPSRRHHAKTTTGCYACKARRVKCDEGRPACKSCTRRNTACQYPFDGGSPSSQIGQQANGSATSISGPTPHLFDALDLRLMHRYCTSTSTRLLPTHGASQVWQMVVPVKAETHPVLQRGVLALAAVDLAASHANIPGESALAAKYRARGLYHQQVALPMFQDMLTRQDPTQNNIIFLYSIMLIFLAFGSLQSTSEAPSVQDILEVFALFRGPRALWHSRNTEDTELGEAILLGDKLKVATPDESAPEVEEAFQAFDTSQMDQVCREATQLLRTTWATVHSAPSDVRAMAHFPAMAEDAFFTKVAEFDKHALLVLRHYSIVLEAHRDRWWVGRWHEILVAAVDTALATTEA